MKNTRLVVGLVGTAALSGSALSSPAALRPAGLIGARPSAACCGGVAALPALWQGQQGQQGQQQGQRRRSQPPPPAAWPRAVAHGVAALLAVAALLGGEVRAAWAENELAALAGSKSTAELVNPQCFANSCKAPVEACAADGDCMKGLACTAKCMGDAQCTVGCFARYDNAQLERVLQCTIEDAGCIAIATQAPGPDAPSEAPPPPKALVKATPASLQGRWYKVLGFNPNYDCFECQRNSFTTAAGARRGGAPASVAAMDVRPSEAVVEVEYAMPRVRLGAAPETFRATLTEKLEFDTTPGAVRTAHTEGRMFGLTFWENWYLIGQNQPREPEFRFVYYTGKTLQNRYEGAFVYARKPELPQASMPSIYRIAREAGLDPTRACCIDNSCYTEPPIEAASPPLFTPVAAAGTLPRAPAPTPTAAAPAGIFGLLPDPLRAKALDLAELLEDPHPPANAMFARQRQMVEVREYDANGFRRPVAEVR